ncbi:hypothetical protein BGZ50_004953 [Haplosporangium sp. Z 11]|nr:hypothetical protein BGZ50_004953 [Haplosporangium sp. Z 11]
MNLQASTQVVGAGGTTCTAPTEPLCRPISAHHSAAKPSGTSRNSSGLDGNSASDRSAVLMSAQSNQNGNDNSSKASHGGIQGHRSRTLTVKSTFSTILVTSVPKPLGPRQQSLPTSSLLTATHNAYGTSTGTPLVTLTSSIMDVNVKEGLNAVTSPKDTINGAKHAETSKTSSRSVFHQLMRLGRWKRNKARSIKDGTSNQPTNTGAVLGNVAMSHIADQSLQGNGTRGAASTSFNPTSSYVQGRYSLPLFDIFTPTDASGSLSVSATVQSPEIEPRQNIMGAIHYGWDLPSAIDPGPSYSQAVESNKDGHGSKQVYVPAIPESDKVRPRNGHDLAVNVVFEVPMPTCVKDHEVQWSWSNAASHALPQSLNQVWTRHKRQGMPVGFTGNFEMYPTGTVLVLFTGRQISGEPTEEEHLPSEAVEALTWVNTWSDNADDGCHNHCEDQHVLMAHPASEYSGTRESTLHVDDWQDSSSSCNMTLYDENEDPPLNHPYLDHQLFLCCPHLRDFFPAIISHPIIIPPSNIVFENACQTETPGHESLIPDSNGIYKQGSGSSSSFSISESSVPAFWAPSSNYVLLRNSTVEMTCGNCRRKFLMTAKDPEIVNRHQRWMCRTRFQQRIQHWRRAIEARFRFGIRGRPG